MWFLLVLLFSSSEASLLSHSLACHPDGSSCTISFPDHDTTMELFADRDDDSFITPQTILQHNKRVLSLPEQQPQDRRRRRTLRFVTTRQKNNHHSSNSWGSGVVDLERNLLVHGVFRTLLNGVLIHNVSSTDDDTEDFNDVVLSLPEGKPWMKFAQEATFSSKKAVEVEDNTDDDEQGFISFSPDCFPQDELTHVFKIDVVIDYGVFEQVTQNVEGEANKLRVMIADLEEMFAVGRLIFFMQMNVRLEVRKLIVGSPHDDLPLSQSNSAGTCVQALGALPQMISWNQQEGEPTGLVMFLSHCFQQITGVSYIGSACSKSGMNVVVSRYSWLVAFHELGHALGMSHTVDTGGLMARGDGTFQGVPQFSPINRNEACPFLSLIKEQDSCPFFYLVPLKESTCGDGILTKDEVCECADRTVNCHGCKACVLVNKEIQCSSEEFLLRTKDMPSVVMVKDPAYWSHPQCCINKKFAPPKTLCGDGLLNVCSLGECQPLCTKYLNWDNPHCGFSSTGCRLGCVFNDKCRFDLENSPVERVSNLPQGTACYLSDVLVGTCNYLTGNCEGHNGLVVKGVDPTQSPTTEAPFVPWTGAPINNGRTMFPTSSPKAETRYPTGKPTGPTSTPSEFPTVKPTLPTNRPTEFPTLKPTLPTNRPTEWPTIAPTMPTRNPTRKPSMAPTQPTNRPTKQPSVSPSVRTKFPSTLFPSVPAV